MEVNKLWMKHSEIFINIKWKYINNQLIIQTKIWYFEIKLKEFFTKINFAFSNYFTQGNRDQINI